MGESCTLIHGAEGVVLPTDHCTLVELVWAEDHSCGMIDVSDRCFQVLLCIRDRVIQHRN